MRFVTFRTGGVDGLAVEAGSGLSGWRSDEPAYPGPLISLLSRGPDAVAAAHSVLLRGPRLDAGSLDFLPPIPRPGRILGIGLNYRAHAAETGKDLPTYPAVFVRFTNTLTGHQSPLVKPAASEQLDFEGELLVVIGRRARHVTPEAALSFVAGYSIFNDGTARDFQNKSPQWTMGKNFDRTAGFGPAFVTADELPPGASGLRIQTRLNGVVVQDSTTADMVFDVASLVSIISAVFALEPGDIITTGTPSGVGVARTPPLFMKAGDRCEVEIDGLGTLSNTVVDEPVRNS